MKRILTLAAAIFAGSAAIAQISITPSLTYSQDFNTLDTANTPSSNLPNGWEIFETYTGSSTPSNDNMYKGNNGGSNAGETYSYGTSGTLDRALGSVASNSLQSSYGAKFVNNSGAPITSFTITLTLEQWRLGNMSAHLDTTYFMHSTTASGVGDTAATWTMVDALMLNSVVTSGSASSALDGNDPANKATVTGTVNVTIPVGGTLVIKWMDKNILGSDDGLAIDDLSITFENGTVPPPQHPAVTSTDPMDNATGVSTSVTQLTAVFDMPVQAGSGSINLININDGTIQSKMAAGPDVQIAGNTVTIFNISLQPGKNYAVQMDSTAFKSDADGTLSEGIYDLTTWNFSTQTSGAVVNVQRGNMPLAVVGVPANGAFKLAFSLQTAGQVSAQIIDIAGRVVLAESFQGMAGAQQRSLNAELAPGTYLVRLSSGIQTAVVKTTMQ